MSAVWLKHAEVYDTWTDGSQFESVPAKETLRITDPSAVNTTNFVLFETELTVVANMGPVLAGGDGKWFEFRLQTPVSLDGNTLYGFDVGAANTVLAGQENDVWETAGTIDANAYAGGSAYTTGSSGDGDNTMTAQTGDRTFLLKLAAVGPVEGPMIASSISGGSLIMSWSGGGTYNVLTNDDLGKGTWGIAIPNAASPVVISNALGNEFQLFYKLQSNQ